MAKPIKHTPILKGKDAINFYNEIDNNKNKKVDYSVVLSIQKDANIFKSLLRR